MLDKPNFRPEIIPSGVFSPRSQMMLPLHLARRKIKAEGMVTRDPRAKERKKYGQKGARKRFQFSKR